MNQFDSSAAGVDDEPGDLVCATVLNSLLNVLPPPLRALATPMSGRHCMRLCSSISYKSHDFAPSAWTATPAEHAMCLCLCVCVGYMHVCVC